MSWKIPVKDQVKLQIEITNYCNAACPQCARENLKINNFSDSFSLNDSYVSLKKFKHWLDKDDWSSLERILFCGNYDESTTNPDLIPICNWIIKNQQLFPKSPEISIHTNGGARNTKFWKELGEISKESNYRIRVVFAIDGFEDTNHLYRKNVDWKKLQQNWRSYIKAGGIAWWQWVMFEHNEHQKHLVEQYAKQEGFRRVKFVGSHRPKVGDIIPTKDKIDEQKIFSKVIPDCYKNTHHSMGLYIGYNGIVNPCCWQGLPSGLSDVYQKNDGDFTQGILNGNNSIQEILDSVWMENFKKNMEQGIFAKCVQKCKINIRNTYKYEKLNEK